MTHRISKFHCLWTIKRTSVRQATHFFGVVMKSHTNGRLRFFPGHHNRSYAATMVTVRASRASPGYLETVCSEVKDQTRHRHLASMGSSFGSNNLIRLTEFLPTRFSLFIRSCHVVRARVLACPHGQANTGSCDLSLLPHVGRIGVEAEGVTPHVVKL